MLAELTDGDSREQILSLLGSETIEDSRDLAHRVWNYLYVDDGAGTVIPASSLWLREDMGYVEETMDLLAENYYASSFQGEMGSQEMDQALQGWLNDQTGGLLERGMGRTGSLTGQEPQIVSVEQIRERERSYRVVCHLKYPNQREGKRTYSIVKGYEDEDGLMWERERRRKS